MSRVRCLCGDCPDCRVWERNRYERAALVGCRCGVRNCDCARWDAIFKEKFEDPEYYKRPVPARGPQSALRDGNLYSPESEEIISLRDLRVPSTEPTAWSKRPKADVEPARSND